MTDPLFLPWVRRGLARALSVADPLVGPLPSSPSLVAAVDVADDRGGTFSAEQPVTVAGPGDVSSLDPSLVVRREPPAGSVGFETNYFPFVELLVPDLPWLLTPAGPTRDGALRPWLVLVVVTDGRPGVSWVDAGRDGSGTLTVDGPVVGEELWDLADSHAWVHVQSMVAAGRIATSVEAGDGRVTARLVCPRRLTEATRYRAALVPAFDLGARAGRGEDVSGATQLGPAWDVDAADQVVLPTYASWTFATSDEAGDFESLCRRLRPDASDARLGYHDAVLDSGGLFGPELAAAPRSFEYQGALVDPGSTGRALGPRGQRWLADGLVPHLDRAATRATIALEAPEGYDPERDDPVAGPPLYGSWPAGTFETPTSGWVHDVNLDAPMRVAAGLGAEIVRRNQHAFLAAAWDQVGALRVVETELNRSRLAAEVATRHAERFAQLDDGTLLFVAGAAASFIDTGRRSAAGQLEASAVVPRGVVTPTFFRGTRATRRRRIGAASAGPSTSGRAATTFLAASAASNRPDELEPVAGFTGSFVPNGTYLGDAFDLVVARSVARIRGRSRGATVPAPVERRVSPTARTSAQLARRGRAASARTAPSLGFEPVRPDRPGLDDLIPTFEPPPRPVPAGDDLSELAARVRERWKPARSIAVGLEGRVRGTAIDPGAPIPTKVVVGAWFPDGLSPQLQQIDPDLLLPGVSSFGRDRVRLLGVNEAYVAALLVGANHEWAREALWRELPVDLAATSFASLFDRPGDPPAPGPDTDLATDIHTWPPATGLADQVGGAGSSTVVLVRAELVRRFPGVVITLLRPRSGEVPIDDGVLDPEHVLGPAFRSSIDAETLVAGFGVDPGEVLDDGWYVSVEEAPSGPRFGLDVGTGPVSGPVPGPWAQLSWRHVDAAAAGLHHLRFSALGWTGTTDAGLTWGRNAAHQAAITYQRPFRVIFPAAALLGGGR